MRSQPLPPAAPPPQVVYAPRAPASAVSWFASFVNDHCLHLLLGGKVLAGNGQRPGWHATSCGAAVTEGVRRLGP